jgi:hypothetical protein
MIFGMGAILFADSVCNRSLLLGELYLCLCAVVMQLNP